MIFASRLIRFAAFICILLLDAAALDGQPTIKVTIDRDQAEFGQYVRLTVCAPALAEPTNFFSLKQNGFPYYDVRYRAIPSQCGGPGEWLSSDPQQPPTIVAGGTKLGVQQIILVQNTVKRLTNGYAHYKTDVWTGYYVLVPSTIKKLTPPAKIVPRRRPAALKAAALELSRRVELSPTHGVSGTAVAVGGCNFSDPSISLAAKTNPRTEPVLIYVDGNYVAQTTLRASCGDGLGFGTRNTASNTLFNGLDAPVSIEISGAPGEHTVELIWQHVHTLEDQYKKKPPTVETSMAIFTIDPQPIVIDEAAVRSKPPAIFRPRRPADSTIKR